MKRREQPWPHLSAPLHSSRSSCPCLQQGIQHTIIHCSKGFSTPSMTSHEIASSETFFPHAWTSFEDAERSRRNCDEISGLFHNYTPTSFHHRSSSISVKKCKILMKWWWVRSIPYIYIYIDLIRPHPIISPFHFSWMNLSHRVWTKQWYHFFS